MSYLRAVTCLSIFVGLLASIGSPAVQAQQPKETNSLQLLAAADELLIDVIAHAEKSVVAIMRVRRAEPGEIPNFQIPDLFNRPRGVFPRAESDLLPDTDFVPTEFGT